MLIFSQNNEQIHCIFAFCEYIEVEKPREISELKEIEKYLPLNKDFIKNQAKDP